MLTLQIFRITSFFSSLFVFTLSALTFLESADQIQVVFFCRKGQFFCGGVIIDHGLLDAKPLSHHGDGGDLSFPHKRIDRKEDHQKYLDKNPGGYCHIPRKLLTMETAGG